MIVDYEYSNNNLIVSYINKMGNVKVKHFPWHSPTKTIPTTDEDPDKSGKYVMWNGKPVKEIYTKYPNKYSVYNFLDELPKEDQKLIFDYSEPNIFFIDIENEILDKKPEPHLAESAILSISIVNKDKALVLGVDPLTKKEIKSIENDVNEKYGKPFEKRWDFKYVCYKNEYELMLNFFKKYIPAMACLSGWNFISYDWVFLVNRARNIGIDPSVASLTGKLKESWMKNDYSEIPVHKMIVDYMELYEKWDTSVKVKESSSLDFVAGAVLGPEFGKVAYTGDLKHLYKTNKRDFIYYNVVDSVLVQLIHEKQKYIDILYAMATRSRVTVKNGFSTLAITEGILRGKLKTQKNILLCRDDSIDDASKSSEGSVAGGFVLPPVRGMAKWTCCYDFASLYPKTIQQFNISADSYKGQKITGKDYSIFNGHQMKIEETDIVLLNGSVFRNEIGIVNQVMGEVYSDRKKFKKIMMKKHSELEDLKKQLKELELTL